MISSVVFFLPSSHFFSLLLLFSLSLFYLRERESCFCLFVSRAPLTLNLFRIFYFTDRSNFWCRHSICVCVCVCALYIHFFPSLHICLHRSEKISFTFEVLWPLSGFHRVMHSIHYHLFSNVGPSALIVMIIPLAFHKKSQIGYHSKRSFHLHFYFYFYFYWFALTAGENARNAWGGEHKY